MLLQNESVRFAPAINLVDNFPIVVRVYSACRSFVDGPYNNSNTEILTITTQGRRGTQIPKTDFLVHC